MTAVDERIQAASRRPVLPGVDLYRALWGIAIAGAIGDIATTAHGLQAGATEANPLVAWAIGTFGIWVLVPLKGAILGWVYMISARNGREYGTAGLAGLSAIQTPVVLSNIATILTL